MKILTPCFWYEIKGLCVTDELEDIVTYTRHDPNITETDILEYILRNYAKESVLPTRMVKGIKNRFDIFSEEAHLKEEDYSRLLFELTESFTWTKSKVRVFDPWSNRSELDGRVIFRAPTEGETKSYLLPEKAYNSVGILLNKKNGEEKDDLFLPEHFQKIPVLTKGKVSPHNTKKSLIVDIKRKNANSLHLYFFKVVPVSS